MKFTVAAIAFTTFFGAAPSPTILLAILPLASAGGIRKLAYSKAAKSAKSTNSAKSVNEPKPKCFPYHYEMSNAVWSPKNAGRVRHNPTSCGWNIQMAEVQFDAGGVRDLHWHRKGAEWGYVSKGECEFTLSDTKNRYVTTVAKEGDVYYFPLGWQHSIQAIKDIADPEEDDMSGGSLSGGQSCTLLLWFDATDGAGSINLSDTIAAYPQDVLKASLKDIPSSIINTFPKKTNAIAKGTIRGELNAPSDNPLLPEDYPLINIKDGTLKEDNGGKEYAVRKEQLLASRTMSGGRIELKEGAMRELHWHTNADELHYVLSGCVRNIVHNNIDFPEVPAEEYTICAGDVGYVPLNFVHFLQAVDGDAVIITCFNDPSWETQGLSGMMSVTRNDINAAVLNTTAKVAEQYFPKKSTPFLRNVDYEELEFSAAAMSVERSEVDID